MTTTQSFAGKFYLVSGFANGNEVFIGKAIDEPFADHLSIEGKTIGFTRQGFMNVKPFTTVLNVPFKDPNFQIQQIAHPEAINEANKIFTTAVTQILRSTYPYTYRWIETSLQRDSYNYNNFSNNNYNNNGPNSFSQWSNRYAFGTSNPFFSFYEGFSSSAEHFRRILFQSPQVTTTREMDKVTELEGNLTIEIGKITNQIAVKFNQLVSRETELYQYFEAIQGFNIPIPTTNYLGGWIYLMTRMQMAKNWAQRSGKTPLVREVNGFTKDGITSLNEVILEHCTTLDTLITEACTQFGIALELYGDLSPFSSYTTPFTGAMETLDANTQHLVGAGV